MEVSIYPDYGEPNNGIRYGVGILSSYIATPDLFKTYEDALLYGINMALENIDNEKSWY